MVILLYPGTYINRSLDHQITQELVLAFMCFTAPPPFCKFSTLPSPSPLSPAMTCNAELGRDNKIVLDVSYIPAR